MAQLTFFFDRNFGTSLPTWLRRVKLPFVVEYHDEKKHGFTQTTEDDEWLRAIGAQNWVVFSQDKRFHKDSMATEAVGQHRIACFYVDGGTLPTWDKLVFFAKNYVKIRHIIKSEKPPYIYWVRHSGRITLVKGAWNDREA